jgi:hypothetical protein
MHNILTIRSCHFGSRKLPGSDDAAPIVDRAAARG